MLPSLPAAGQVPRHLVGGGYWSLSLSSPPSTSPLAPPPAPLYASTTTSSPHAFTRLLRPLGVLWAALQKSDPTPPFLFMALEPPANQAYSLTKWWVCTAHRESSKHHAAGSQAVAHVPDTGQEASSPPPLLGCSAPPPWLDPAWCRSSPRFRRAVGSALAPFLIPPSPPRVAPFQSDPSAPPLPMALQPAVNQAYSLTKWWVCTAHREPSKHHAADSQAVALVPEAVDIAGGLPFTHPPPPGYPRAALPQSSPTPPYLFMALEPPANQAYSLTKWWVCTAHRESSKHHAADSQAVAQVPDPDNDASDGLASILQPLLRVLTVSASQCLAGPAALYDKV